MRTPIQGEAPQRQRDAASRCGKLRDGDHVSKRIAEQGTKAWHRRILLRHLTAERAAPSGSRQGPHLRLALRPGRWVRLSARGGRWFISKRETPPKGVTPMAPSAVARIIRNHWDGVINAAISDITNAMSESVNSHIQRIKKRACGFPLPHPFPRSHPLSPRWPRPSSDIPSSIHSKA
jgi:hypothetical protein